MERPIRRPAIPMGDFRPLLPFLSAVLIGCNLGGLASSAPTPTVRSEAAVSEQRCGDGVCDGPESADTCPADCPAAPAGEISSGTEENTFRMVNPASGAQLYIVVTYPEGGSPGPLPAIVLIPGGLGTKEPLNGTDPDAVSLAAAGYAAIQFDADGRGATLGEEDYNGFIHQDGLAALILAAGQIPGVDPDRLGVISRSYGVTMAAGALGRHPDLPVRFYID
jgi:hypothetical protein